MNSVTNENLLLNKEKDILMSQIDKKESSDNKEQIIKTSLDLKEKEISELRAHLDENIKHSVIQDKKIEELEDFFYNLPTHDKVQNDMILEMRIACGLEVKDYE